ncbi:zinc finger protein 90-like [Stegodyphus dumicola]|uniref:zinc finger protein 90-like n=1 Tax=Stegodyphus dumicola TaxID=202533 RepID=UPI0015AE9B32|nr:zinc finger protein 90-like [Stegodyphus dumicola]
MNCDSSSPISGSGFDSESDDFEFEFFSSPSRSEISGSEITPTDNEEADDTWSSSSFETEDTTTFNTKDAKGEDRKTEVSTLSKICKHDHNDNRKQIVNKLINLNIQQIAYDKSSDNGIPSTSANCSYSNTQQIRHDESSDSEAPSASTSATCSSSNTQQTSDDKSSDSEASSALTSANNNGKFYCDFCGERYNSEAERDIHKLHHLVYDSYVCEVCNQLCKKREEYILHYTLHDQGCDVSKYIPIKKDTTRHRFRCKFHCGKTYRFSRSLSRHLKKHIKSYTCDVCRSSFPTLLLCHKHKLSHVQKCIHVCNVCGKIFHRAYQLTVHMQTHKTEKKYECVECGVAYRYETSLMRHSLKYHSPDSPKILCDVCGKLFKSKKMFSRHTILHAMTKLIECSECTQTFKYRSGSRFHHLILKNTKPFCCSLCGNHYKSESLLQSHKAMHY